MRMIAVGLLLATTGYASVVGVSTAAPSLTEARVRAEVPKAKQGIWLAYLKQSEEQKATDKAALAAERAGLAAVPELPKENFAGRGIPLHREGLFYKSDAARKIADVIVSYQIPSGGWSKNLALNAPRAKGQMYAANNLSKYLGPDDFDAPKDPNWNYVGTLDNDATNTELHYLAEMSAAWPGREGDSYRASFLRGVEYLLRAQFPNGGWPQVWPLEGGYHDAITFNDDAVTESASMLTNVAEGQSVVVKSDTGDAPPSEDYSFVPKALRLRSKVAAARALVCILQTQIKIGGVLTVWAQQHDALTLKPGSGRNFEPEALSSGESASVMEYLMSLDKPSPAIVASVDAAAAWFEAHQVMGYTWSGGRGTEGGRKLKAVAGAGPLWARYYSLTTEKPIFGDRDKTIHDDVMELSLERRNGYAWYSGGPAGALTRYSEWKKSHAR
jgi:PelA/Pel-15E family pectate lyase